MQNTITRYQCREPLGEGNSMPVQRSSLKITADNHVLVGDTEEWLSLLRQSMYM